MKKLLGILTIGLMSMTVQTAHQTTQPVVGTVEGFDKLPEMKLALFTLGADFPIEIGTVNKGGDFSIDLSQATLPADMAEEDMAVFFGGLHTAFDGAFSRDDFGLLADVIALKNPYISIMASRNRWAGNVFPVTSEEVKNWLEDSAYNNAVIGSYLNIIYVEEPITLDYSASSKMPYQGEEILQEYQFKLTLEPGFNWVQYDIEEVYETDPKIRGSFPSKITIRNMDDSSQFRWIGKFF